LYQDLGQVRARGRAAEDAVHCCGRRPACLAIQIQAVRLDLPYTARMRVFVALLRAVNVGSTGRLAMSDLRRLCEQAGFKDCRTYIQSGNVLFRSPLSEAGVKAKLEKALSEALGRPSSAAIRTRAELASITERNPWKSAPASQVLVLFLDAEPPRDALDGLHVPGREKLQLDGRELFIHYPDGMGRSKLRVPLAQIGTGRNLNTVAKLAALAAELEHN
jgi:uncharacterized protein (DUF1697 family)